MKKSLILVLVSVVLVIVGWFIWSAPRQSSAPESAPKNSVADTDVSAVNSVDLGNIDSGLQPINADLNQL